MHKLKKIPYMPVYCDDWMASRTVLSLSLAAQGLFLRCLILQWESGPLPASPEMIARIVGNPVGFADAWAEIEPLFPMKDGARANPRGAERKSEWDSMRNARIDAAARSNALQGERKANAKLTQSDHKINANGDAKSTPPTPTPTPTPNPNLTPNPDSPPLASQASPPPGGRARGGRKPREVFTPPTLAEVAGYAGTVTGGSALSAEDFHDHFTANGWKVSGRTPMVDWNAAYRRWVREDRKRAERFTPRRAADSRERRAALAGEVKPGEYARAPEPLRVIPPGELRSPFDDVEEAAAR